MCVVADRKLSHWGCGVKLELIYAVMPWLFRYSCGLSEPSEVLMRFSLYQRMDLHLRKIVGWALTAAMPAALVCAALQMAAIVQRNSAPGLIVHSDRGT